MLMCKTETCTVLRGRIDFNYWTPATVSSKALNRFLPSSLSQEGQRKSFQLSTFTGFWKRVAVETFPWIHSSSIWTGLYSADPSTSANTLSYSTETGSCITEYHNIWMKRIWNNSIRSSITAMCAQLKGKAVHWVKATTFLSNWAKNKDTVIPAAGGSGASLQGSPALTASLLTNTAINRITPEIVINHERP